jgi:DNA-binding CsgD family transcriptional regulator
LDTFLECGESCERSLITNPSVLAWRSGAALAAARLGELDQARELAETELGWATDFGTPRAIGVSRRTLALVLGGDESIDMLREARAAFESCTARLEHARTLVELGAALRRAGSRRDARGPLKEALDMAHGCGAVAIAQRARDELAAAGARPRRVELTGVDSLTPSERRISAMASEGLSNPQIAQALFLTRRTVEMHLTNAYRKLDIGSRRELPAVLGVEAGD